MPPFAVKSLDHVVLTVKSIETTVDFYKTHLGMQHEVFSSKGADRYHEILSLFPSYLDQMSTDVSQPCPQIRLPEDQPPSLR